MAQPSKARTYDPSKCAVFMKTNERFGGLSNMAPGFPLSVAGVAVRTSEALYQACRFPHRPDVQALIIAERSPMTAKMRGKPFRDDTRPDWNEVRVNVMRWCLRVKLAQNFDLFKELLLSTGEMPIVEKKIRRTDFWGAKFTEDGTLVGQNVLGRLLMELRELVKHDSSEVLTTVPPLPISKFRLMDRDISDISRSFEQMVSSVSNDSALLQHSPVQLHLYSYA
jgi:type I restriction enzyme S subunit